MVASYHRRDISDKAWALIEPYTIGNKGTWGGNAKDTRLFINAVFWILRTGAPWCDLPPDYCNWNTVQRRFCRWRDKGIGETILEAIVDGPISSLLCNCDGGVRFGVASVSPVPAESRLKSGFFARKPCGTGFFESGFKSAFFPILERNVGR